jgi:hypothetical protein
VEDELGVRLGPVVVNAVLPQIDGLDPDRVGSVDVTDDERTALETAAAFRAGRAALQAEQIERLEASLPLPQIRLPQLFGTQIGPDEIDVLADVLTTAIGELPEVVAP